MKEVPVVHESRFETEKYTEEFYKQSKDPWNNQGKYIKAFEGIFDPTILIYKKVNLIDIGCGGGNVLEGLITQLKKIGVDYITLKGIDVSSTSIEYLRVDERFYNYSSKFLVRSMTSPEFTISDLILPDIFNIVTIVDTFYYIRNDQKWHQAANKIVEDLPVNSYIIVADSAGTVSYREYYGRNSQDVEIISKGQSIDPIVESEFGHRAKYLKWVIYKKVKTK